MKCHSELFCILIYCYKVRDQSGNVWQHCKCSPKLNIVNTLLFLIQKLICVFTLICYLCDIFSITTLHFKCVSLMYWRWLTFVFVFIDASIYMASKICNCIVKLSVNSCHRLIIMCASACLTLYLFVLVPNALCWHVYRLWWYKHRNHCTVYLFPEFILTRQFDSH